MKKKWMGLCCIALFVIASCSTGSRSVSNGNAHVMFLRKGSVVVLAKTGEKTFTQSGERITFSNGESISTGKNTRIIIENEVTGDEIEAYSNTEINIEKLEETAAGVNLRKGKARFSIRTSKSLRRNIRIHTSTALIGVKGTEFVVDSTENETNLLTLEGEVLLANASTPDVQVTVSANQASRVQVARLPTTPVTVSDDTIQNILESDEPEAFKRIEFGPAIEEISDAVSFIEVIPKRKSNQLFWPTIKASTRFTLHWTNNPDQPVPEWNTVQDVNNGFMHRNLTSGKVYYYTVSYLDESGKKRYYLAASGAPLP